MSFTRELFSSSIVAVGHFNPAIFTPDWLEKNQLIGSADAESAREKVNKTAFVVTQQIATFETPWFVLQVLENQFSLTSKEALTPAFMDLGVGILQLVSHTPITAIGLNFMAHYKIHDVASYHAVGDALAPKPLWSPLFPGRHVGMMALTMKVQDGTRENPGKSRDYQQFTVQPSPSIKSGVFFSLNDHHEVDKEEAKLSRPGELAAAIIDSHWKNTWATSTTVFESLLASILGPQEKMNA